MCLGIPGRLVELLDHEHLARVDVSGVGRVVNIGLLEDEQLEPGDWVLIHVGFAMSKIDEEEAARALASLQLMGQAYDDELEAFWSSQIAADQAAEAAMEAQAAARPAAERGAGD
jgi:hydrogenase expression/formation protein HypC